MRKSLSPSELGFDDRDRQHLSKALARAKQARLFRRLQAVLLVAQDRSFQESAQITGLSLRSLYRLVGRYLQAHAVGCLADRPRPGRPLKAPGLTGDKILRELKRSPLQLGYRTNVWTVKTLALQLNERYRCGVGPWALRQRMKRLGLVYKRPRYFYSEKDPHRAQKKGGPGAEIKAPSAPVSVAL